MQVLFLQSHSTCFGRNTHSVPALIRCGDLPATITYVPVAAVLVLNTPDDGRLRPKHVEWLCRNKTCTVLHQVDVSFDLVYLYSTAHLLFRLFAKLRKATISFAMSISPSVCPHGTTLLLLDEFSWNPTFEHFFEKLLRKFKFHSNRIRTAARHMQTDMWTFWSYLGQFFLQ